MKIHLHEEKLRRENFQDEIKKENSHEGCLCGVSLMFVFNS